MLALQRAHAVCRHTKSLSLERNSQTSLYSPELVVLEDASVGGQHQQVGVTLGLDLGRVCIRGGGARVLGAGGACVIGC